MKKLVVFFLAVCLLAACKKGTDNHLESSLESSLSVESSVDLSAIASTFLWDSTFALVMEKAVNNSVDIHQILGVEGGSGAIAEHHELMDSSPSFKDVIEFYDNLGVDTSVVLTKQAEVFAAWLQLLDENPIFARLDLQDQLWVINDIKDTIKTETFRLANPTNPLVQTFENILVRVSTDPVIIENGLSWGEVVECAVGSLGGALGNGWSTIRSLFGVITGHNLGWGGILNVTKSAMATLMHANAAGAAITFGFCLAGAALF